MFSEAVSFSRCGVGVIRAGQPGCSRPLAIESLWTSPLGEVA